MIVHVCSQNEIVYADCQGVKYKGKTSLAALFMLVFWLKHQED